MRPSAAVQRALMPGADPSLTAAQSLALAARVYAGLAAATPDGKIDLGDSNSGKIRCVRVRVRVRVRGVAWRGVAWRCAPPCGCLLRLPPAVACGCLPLPAFACVREFLPECREVRAVFVTSTDLLSPQ